MAGRTYTYTFLAKDLMSSKFSKISQKGQETFGKINRQHQKFNNNVDKSRSKLNGMGTNLKSVVGLVGSLGLAFSASQVFGSVIKLGADMEQTRISFETMLGSADKANKVINQLNQFSNKTPFKNKEVITAGRNLLAYGVANNKLLPSLKAIGDVSAGLKIPFNELSQIYGKIKVQNTVYSEDLNQLAGRGIPIFTELSKVMGVAPESIKKLASQGKITFPYIEQAFTNMTSQGGKFFNLMDKQSKSFSGKWSTFMGKLQLTGIKLGEKLLPYLTRFLDWALVMVDYLPLIPAFFDSIYQSVQNNALVFGLLGGALMALSANFIIGKTVALGFMLVQKAQAIVTGVVTAAQWAWNAAMYANPIGIVIALILALIAGIVYAYQKIGWFRGGVNAIWETLKGFGGAIKDFVIDRIKQMAAGITGIGKTLLHFFKGDWKKAWESGKDAVKNLTGIGVGNGKKLFNNLKNTGKNAAEAYNKGVAEVANKKNKGSVLDLIKKKAGMSAPIGGGTTAGSSGTDDIASTASGGINSITGGGARQTHIQVSFEKLVENFTIKSQNISQGLDESEENLKRMLLRVMNSINQTQVSPV